MEKKYFTVEEAASIMRCHPSTIYRLLAEGWLKRPKGWGIRDKSALVSEKSLFQLMIFDSVNKVNGRNYEEFKKWRKNFRRFFSQTSSEKRFSIDEGRGQAV